VAAVEAEAEEPPRPAFDAIAFDLLTALVDSWTLWSDVAGSEQRGRDWRLASLRLVTSTGTYVPYERLVARAAEEIDLPADRSTELLRRWGELRPWPETATVLGSLRGKRLAVVTNCSQRLAELAAAVTGGEFEVIVSAERAGAYKPDPRPYRLALEALSLPAKRVLFVAGSAHDLPGAMGVGMPVYWSNRQRLKSPSGGQPLQDAVDLRALPSLLG
jgi:2-haloacid dehalogenase